MLFFSPALLTDTRASKYEALGVDLNYKRQYLTNIIENRKAL